MSRSAADALWPTRESWLRLGQVFFDLLASSPASQQMWAYVSESIIARPSLGPRERQADQRIRDHYGISRQIGRRAVASHNQDEADIITARLARKERSWDGVE